MNGRENNKLHSFYCHYGYYYFHQQNYFIHSQSNRDTDYDYFYTWTYSRRLTTKERQNAPHRTIVWIVRHVLGFSQSLCVSCVCRNRASHATTQQQQSLQRARELVAATWIEEISFSGLPFAAIIWSQSYWTIGSYSFTTCTHPQSAECSPITIACLFSS